MAKTKPKGKNPHAVALGRKSARARMRNLTPEQRSEQARQAVASRKDRQKPEVQQWWGLFDTEDQSGPDNQGNLVKYSLDKRELVACARAAPERLFLIERLDHDPRTRLRIIPEFANDAGRCLQALENLQALDAEKGGQ